MRRRRIWLWITIGLVATVVFAVAATIAAVPLTSDTLRHRMIETLSARLDADVAIGDLHWRVFPTLHASGANLSVRRRDSNDTRPLIAVKSFTVDANIRGLMRKRVAHVSLDGLEVAIPPDDRDDEATPDSGVTSTVPPIVEGVVIDTLDAVNGQVITIPKKKDKAPSVWAIHMLRLHNVGAGQAMPFQAAITNAIPPGEIDTSGTFGPWLPDKPGGTALDGSFTFARADLSIFHGISGILAARGAFRGTLARIEVDGETDTPDFMVKLGGHPFALHTIYRTLVDGTNGDTILQRIDAQFGSSSLTAKGAVVDAEGPAKGRTVRLDITMDRARLEDVLMMAINAAPPMRGALRLKTRFVLPPGETDVADRLRLDGTFAVGRVRFTNYDVQGKIDELSRRGRGRVDDATREKVVSDFEGRFRLGGGHLQLPRLAFSVPGAQVQLAGAYALKPELLDFEGRLLMDAKISQTQTGIKSFLLKAIDPLFKRPGGGSAIPIHIRGNRADPDFGIDMRRVFRRGDRS